MVVDVEVKRNYEGFSVGDCRVSGQEDGEFSLALYTAKAVLPNRSINS